MASNLPVQLTTFIGRELELTELRDLVENVRLLTLLGAGGIGKTRLAMELARSLEQTNPADGVWLVEMAALHDPELVVQAVAAVLDIRGGAEQPLRQTICERLKKAELTLVLDNCEHLVSACAELAEDVLRACPDVRIIVTSRQPLGVAGETAWRVPALHFPGVDADAATDEVGASDSARLFVERTRSVLPSFALNDRNARAVAQICRRLDGIPLAIELAAARTSALGVEQIAARLDDRFRLLAAASQRADPRHRTLRATVAWSYDLLSVPEQILFRRLAVFAGGWTLEAAEAICAGESLAGEDVLDLLMRLVDQSLVLAEGQDAVARYGLLETLRQFAAEQLQAAGEGPFVSDGHLHWYSELAERADHNLNGPGQGTWLDVFEREHDNLRAALRRALDKGAIEQALRLAAACSYFWQIRGHRYRSEGLRWLQDALTASTAATAAPTTQARALYWAGTFAGELHDFERATGYLEQSLQRWQEIGNSHGATEAQLGLAVMFRDTGEYARAEQLLDSSLAQARHLSDRLTIARILRCLGTVALRLGQGEAASAVLSESLEILQALGESHLVGHVLDHLGEAEQTRGAFDRAVELHRRGTALLKGAGCMEGVNTSLYLQSLIAQRRGDRVEAVGLAMRSLRGYRVLGNRRDLPDCLELVAECVAESRPERAAQLFGAAEKLRQVIRQPLPPVRREAYAGGTAAARRAMGKVAFQDAYALGRSSLSPDEAIDAAINCAESVIAVTPVTANGPLTRREAEVAQLVGRGLSNREIASALVVSVRTAEAHVTNVLNKLGLRSRAQLAVWAAEHGLLLS